MSRTMVLKSGGYSVFEARDYQQALAALDSELFDLMLLDHDLPRSDCEEFLTAAAKASVVMPVIALSSTHSDGMFRAGAFVVDAHQPQELLDTVGELVAPKKLTANS